MMGRATSFLTGICAGGGLTYFFDPDSGRRRRALARDRVDHLRHRFVDAAEVAVKDAANRARGAAATVGRLAVGEATPSDDVLAARVRSAIGAAVSHPRAIEVAARGGVVHLSGPVLGEDVGTLLSSVRSVRGVSDLEEELEIHESSEGVPALQGPARRSRGARRAPAAQAAAVAVPAAFAVLVGGRLVMRIAAYLAPQLAAAAVASLALSVARQESRSRYGRGSGGGASEAGDARASDVG